MKKLVLLFCISIALGSSVFAQEEKAAKNKLDYPVTKEKMIGVLKDRQFEDDEMIATIEAYGVDFQITPAIEQEMRRYGANSKIIAALRQNFRYRIGVANAKARNLAVPAYPGAAKAVGASGTVNVLVYLDEEGEVIAAKVLSGHPLLAEAALKAAEASSFEPTLLQRRKVKVVGVIVYNFATK